MVKKLAFVIVFVLFLALSVSAKGGEASEAAVGDTLLYTVMITDTDESFNEDMISTVKHHLNRVENYYEARAPAEANLDISMEYHTATIDYSGDYRSDRSFIPQTLEELGYGRISNYRSEDHAQYEMTKKLVADQKSEDYDNVALILVAPDSGRSYMVPLGKAEYTTVYYYEWESGFAELLNLDDTPSAVYAHELGHLFGAEDEYKEEGNTPYGGISDNPVRPMQRLYPSFNYETGPSVEDSIMVTHAVWEQLGWFDINTPLSSWARGMIGWRDFDLDGTIDAQDRHIPVRFPLDRQPILNAGVDTGSRVKYTNFDDVTATAVYDDTSVVFELGFALRSPAGQYIDEAAVTPENKVAKSASLQATVPAAAKPGNWTVIFRYGSAPAADYPIEVIAPLLRIHTNKLDFGRVNVEDTASAAVDIANDGKMALDITEEKITSEESVVDTPSSFGVASQAERTYPVRLSPSDLGPITGEMVLTTNDPRQPTLLLPFMGFAYAIRNLRLTAPTTKKVDQDVSIDISYDEATGRPTDYALTVERDGRSVTEKAFVEIQKAAGEATLAFRKYGDYTVTVDKRNTTRYEYRPDTANITVERIRKPLQLAMTVDTTTIKEGDTITVSTEANGRPVEPTVLVDGKRYGHGQTVDVQLTDPGNRTITVQKDTVTTDREIREYNSDSLTVTVEERSTVGKILYWLRNLF